MKESARKPFGDPGKGYHIDRCYCRHAACGCLKLDFDLWCCHWFFLHWVPSSEMLPSDVLEVLSDRMGTTEFDYFVNPTSTGTFRILVYIEDLMVLDGEYFDLIPRTGDARFVREQCRAWRLPCCQEALVPDWEYWRSRLTETDGPPNFSKFRKGGPTLVDELTDQVEERTEFGRLRTRSNGIVGSVISSVISESDK